MFDDASLFTAPAPARQQSARMLLPRPSLAHCVRGMVLRDTRGLALSDEQRFNYFPANPTCVLSWYLSGSGTLIEPDARGLTAGERRPMPGRLVLCGPFSRPYVTWNPGPVHTLSLLLLPDAWFALTGIEPGELRNRVLAAPPLLNADWQALAQGVFDASSDAERVQRLEDSLDPLWQAVRPAAPRATLLLDDWRRSLTLRAANSGIGRSARQIERRIKQWTGQPLRELRGLGRAERVFYDSIVAQESGSVNWTDLASGAGFADQSHLCRQVRRITGFTPEELRRHIAEDEGFWPYRAWGFSDTGVPRAPAGPPDWDAETLSAF